MSVDKVWIVKSGHFYEGSTIEGIFKTPEAAGRYMQNTYEIKGQKYYYRALDLNDYYVDFVDLLEYEVKE